MHISCRKKVHKRKFFHWEGGQKEKRDRLSEDVVQSSSLEIFRTKPDTVLGTLLHFSRGVGGDVKRSFFFQSFCDSMKYHLKDLKSVMTWFEWWAVGCPGLHSSEIYIFGCCDLTSMGSWAPHRHTLSVLLCAMGDRTERVKVQGLLGGLR